MKSSDQIEKLATALAKVQLDLDPVVKDSTNPHFKNKYASLDTIIEYVRPILAKEGLTIVQGGEPSDNGVSVTTMLLHTSGQWIGSTLTMPLEKGTAQSAGSAITYGRRYGLGAILALATEEDDDAERATPRSGAETTGGRGASASALSSEANRGGTPSPSASSEQLCPICSGRMWDNRATKTKATQPDFKCRDRSCKGVIWPPKDKKASFPKGAVAAGNFDDFPAALEDQGDDLVF